MQSKSKSRRIILMFFDVVFISVSYLLALYIRFDGVIGDEFISYFNKYKQYIVYITIIKILVYSYFKLYKSIWRYASIEELINILVAIIISNAAVLSFLFVRQSNLPRSIYAITALLDMVFIGGIRFSLRTFSMIGEVRHLNNNNQKRILIIGGGDAGAMLIREYKNHSQLNSKPIAIIDDNEMKHGQIINGVPVVGGRMDIPTMVIKLDIEEIIIAIPSESKSEISSLIEICKETKAKLKILPGIYELIDGDISISKIRDVEIGDLLGREEITVDLNEVSSYIKDKVVLVTGGGGSIGSELCRQIARYNPKKLIILDIYENSAYDIQNELLRSFKDLNLKTYIGSIRDKDRISELISKERPKLIFHAAAHKHVPLMEDSPKEAIKNNVFGTLNLAKAAHEFGVERFVMISTDKAVNPTNIMGASKRVCEMIIQSINDISDTEFVAVRFGNVLGSNGSVIPLFKKQIEDGGPVTVTHEDIIRYFMTIPEAVQLVIQAGAMAIGGEIFVLDMGEPVKIVDLARDLIRLSGFDPDVDMPIKITGLRPGEKLFEELLLDEEGISATKHNKIFIGKPISRDYRLLLRSLEEVRKLIKDGTEEEVIEHIKTIVPNYTNGESQDKLENQLSYSKV